MKSLIPMCNLKKLNKQTNLQSRNRLTDIENKLMRIPW